jgi:hypothetical protein
MVLPHTPPHLQARLVTAVVEMIYSRSRHDAWLEPDSLTDYNKVNTFVEEHLFWTAVLHR